MSAEIDHDIASAGETVDEVVEGVTGPEDTDLTEGETPAQVTADDETRAPEQDGGETPRS